MHRLRGARAALPTRRVPRHVGAGQSQSLQWQVLQALLRQCPQTGGQQLAWPRRLRCCLVLRAPSQPPPQSQWPTVLRRTAGPAPRQRWRTRLQEMSPGRSATHRQALSGSQQPRGRRHRRLCRRLRCWRTGGSLHWPTPCQARPRPRLSDPRLTGPRCAKWLCQTQRRQCPRDVRCGCCCSRPSGALPRMSHRSRRRCQRQCRPQIRWRGCLGSHCRPARRRALAVCRCWTR